MLADISLLDGVSQLGQIFYFIVLPILLTAGIGYVIHRFLGLDMGTLRKLNFYFVMPAMVYVSIVNSRVGVGEIGIVVGFVMALMVCMSALTYLVAYLRGLPSDQRRAMMMTTILYNCGNYGLPLQQMAFRRVGLGDRAMGLQVFVMVTQNFLQFTYGILLVAGGKKGRHWRQNLMHVVKFPPLYALVAAVITVLIRNALGDRAPVVAEAMQPFWQSVTYVKAAFLAVALGTLGAQLGTVARGGPRYPITLSVLLRLVVGPVVGLGLILLFGFKGFVAQVLLIGTTSPTAVNCMLLCLEFECHPDYAARAVFYSTLLSPITVTLVIFLAQSGLLPQLAY
jgi:malate permease and related proteins